MKVLIRLCSRPKITKKYLMDTICGCMGANFLNANFLHSIVLYNNKIQQFVMSCIKNMRGHNRCHFTAHTEIFPAPTFSQRLQTIIIDFKGSILFRLPSLVGIKIIPPALGIFYVIAIAPRPTTPPAHFCTPNWYVFKHIHAYKGIFSVSAPPPPPVRYAPPSYRARAIT